MMTKGVSMKFSQLAFIVTDDCNFNCAYCRQIKDSSYMNRSTPGRDRDNCQGTHLY
jgi:molybdenum cofactor biosynthesis enzyme MoaA